MQNAIAVSLETSAVWIFIFWNRSVTGADSASGKWRHQAIFGVLTHDSVGNVGGADACPRICVSKCDALSG
jgi:hypothetical protein